jgi:hypothetical protein
MDTTLEDCKLISSKEYMELENPEFIGQTLLDENDEYFMVWKCGEELFKTKNKVLDY